jgi:hypothetical protein
MAAAQELSLERASANMVRVFEFVLQRAGATYAFAGNITPSNTLDVVSKLLPQAVKICRDKGDKSVLIDAEKQLKICIKCYEEQKRCQCIVN